jgi:hypothetical protein
MDDERISEGQREPLWPPDSRPGLPQERATAPETPPVSDAPTERIPATPVNAPVSGEPREPEKRRLTAPADTSSVSDAPTTRMTAAPAPTPPQASDIPTHRLTAPPPTPPARAASPANEVSETETVRTPALEPAQWPTLRPAPPPPTRPARGGGALAWIRERWILLAALVALLFVVVTSLSAYNYAESLAAQPQRIMTHYCSALIHADYKSAYALLTPSLQAQSTLAQYEADSAARDIISGRVKTCSGIPTQHLSALSFLNNPRSMIFNLTLTRTSEESGQIALARDATGWHVAALSSGVAGVDLGPLHTEQALCQAFIARKYDVAYGLLSTPYQREQGSETAFARAFGKNLAITGCAPSLEGYTVDSADQRASFQVTLNVVVSGASATTKLTLPAKLTLVREPDGWRVDTIAPLLSQ